MMLNARIEGPKSGKESRLLIASKQPFILVPSDSGAGAGKAIRARSMKSAHLVIIQSMVSQ
jgi:hypothetical protein